jgi:hypothetical protein
MDTRPQTEQAIIALVRDIEARQVPRALELLEQVRIGAPLLEDDQVFLVAMLYASERVSTLAHAANDLQDCDDARRLGDCVKNLVEDIVVTAVNNEGPQEASTQAPDGHIGCRLSELQRPRSGRLLRIAS